MRKFFTGLFIFLLIAAVCANLMCFGPLKNNIAGVLNASKAELSEETVQKSRCRYRIPVPARLSGRFPGLRRVLSPASPFPVLPVPIGSSSFRSRSLSNTRRRSTSTNLPYIN